MKFFQDRIGSGGPSKRLCLGVVMSDEVIDSLDELLDAGERSTANCFVRDEREEAFDLIEPRTVGRDEVHVPARSRGWPGLRR